MTSNVRATSQLRGHFARSSAALIEDLGVAFDTARGHDPGEHRMRRAARLSALPQQRQIHAIGVMPVRPEPDRQPVDRPPGTSGSRAPASFCTASSRA